MRIVIVGAGGIGGYYGGLMALRGHDVTFIARGTHLKKIQESGLQVKSPHGDFHIYPGIHQ
jgi:2-dehydropantoate 2-reductase